MDPSDAVMAFVEDVALFFEQAGMPRIAGRILGYLLVCDPPHRSASELAEELDVSQASVSTASRMLRAAGLVEPAAVRGERATFLRLRNDGFEGVFEQQMRQTAAFRVLADRGLELLSGESPIRTERLRSLRAIYRFYESEMPKLLQKWREERDDLLRGEVR